jgi:hypothetical protein
MAVTSGQRTRGWQGLLQCGVNTASEVADIVAGKLSALADPRSRLLRKRRWALRLGLFFGFSCVFWAVLTVVLSVWGWFALLLVITGLIAAVQAIPATLLLFRYRWLRSTPLPAQRPRSARRRLPPPGSAARPAMFALGASERGFFSLLGVMERGQMLPANEICELTTVANRTAAAMSATAAEVVSMERAMSLTAQSRPALTPTINAFTAQLSAGVRQYNEMVTAAAQLVSSANGGPPSANGGPSAQRYRDELAGATDRLVGWAQAFDELGGLPAA